MSGAIVICKLVSNSGFRTEYNPLDLKSSITKTDSGQRTLTSKRKGNQCNQLKIKRTTQQKNYVRISRTKPPVMVVK